MRIAFSWVLVVWGCCSHAPQVHVASLPVAPRATPPAKVVVTEVPNPWIEDDFDRALALAKSTHRPLFIDAWATWCHTCRSMRSYVLSDKTIPHERFVWLSIDVDQEKNATVVSKLPAQVLPTFFVIDPEDQALHGRWEGAAAVSQMRGFLADSERSVQIAHTPNQGVNDPLALMRDGDRAAMGQKWADAARAYA